MSLTSKRLIFSLSAILTATLVLTASKIQPLANSLHFEVLATNESNVRDFQRIQEGDRISTYQNGFAFLTLKPWKSINIDQLSCTDLEVNQLNRAGDGTALSISYKDRLLCPTRAYVRITSKLYSKNSSISTNLAGRFVKLHGTKMAVSKASNGALLIGVEEGSVDASYLGFEQSISPDQYVRSFEGAPLLPPLKAPEPYIKVVGIQPSGLWRICTDIDNQIVVDGITQPQTGTDQTCADIKLETIWTVLTPTGKVLSWHFIDPVNRKLENG